MDELSLLAFVVGLYVGDICAAYLMFYWPKLKTKYLWWRYPERMKKIQEYHDHLIDYWGGRQVTFTVGGKKIENQDS